MSEDRNDNYYMQKCFIWWITNLKSDSINEMDYMLIFGTEPSSVSHSTFYALKYKNMVKLKGDGRWHNEPIQISILVILEHQTFCSKS